MKFSVLYHCYILLIFKSLNLCPLVTQVSGAFQKKIINVPINHFIKNSSLTCEVDLRWIASRLLDADQHTVEGGVVSSRPIVDPLGVRWRRDGGQLVLIDHGRDPDYVDLDPGVIIRQCFRYGLIGVDVGEPIGDDDGDVGYPNPRPILLTEHDCPHRVQAGPRVRLPVAGRNRLDGCADARRVIIVVEVEPRDGDVAEREHSEVCAIVADVRLVDDADDEIFDELPVVPRPVPRVVVSYAAGVVDHKHDVCLLAARLACLNRHTKLFVII